MIEILYNVCILLYISYITGLIQLMFELYNIEIMIFEIIGCSYVENNFFR